MKPILSFILPCYNVENYIGACLDSLFAQDIPEEEYEVICVNDCSSDCTEKIIRNYQEKYSIIRLFNHTMNKTAGGARNTGLENALGKYVWFVDPDDIIEPNVVRHLLNHCITGDLDILMFNHREINKDGNELSVKSTFINSEVYSGLTYINRFFEKKLAMISIVWLEIFKVDFLKKNMINFPEIIFGEDTLFVWRSIILAKRVQSIEEICYVYRYNDFSISGSFTLKPNAYKIFSRSFIFGAEVLKLKESLNTNNRDIKLDLIQNANWNINHFFYDLIKINQKEKRQFYLLCKNHKSLLYELNNSMTRRSKILTCMLNYGFYSWYFTLQLLNFSQKNK